MVLKLILLTICYLKSWWSWTLDCLQPKSLCWSGIPHGCYYSRTSFVFQMSPDQDRKSSCGTDTLSLLRGECAYHTREVTHSNITHVSTPCQDWGQQDGRCHSQACSVWSFTATPSSMQLLTLQSLPSSTFALASQINQRSTTYHKAPELRKTHLRLLAHQIGNLCKTWFWAPGAFQQSWTSKKNTRDYSHKCLGEQMPVMVQIWRALADSSHMLVSEGCWERLQHPRCLYHVSSS